jgi:2-C-methyl-D-erythritol 4-phosphate cytidylyltransferase / 2-C-methyl-D-erythritol 2,4-cyclodiphosphate synthase
MTTAAIIVAAGRGNRAGGDTPKQWQMLSNQTVASRTVAAFVAHPRIDALFIVMHADDIAAGYANDIAATQVAGADTRTGSVLAGLHAAQEYDTVLIHDAARPLVSAQIIDDVLDALQTYQAAAPAVPVTDALWIGENCKVTGTQSRDNLWRAQTPQGFDRAALLEAHAAYDGEAADDVTIARAAGIVVAITNGHEDNLKITGPDDFARAAQQLRGDMDIRLGNGFDVHRFKDGDHVWLCGVKVPHDKALSGHSDADVGMHAVTDAIYGALGMGDIGQHFPPSDPQWKGAESHIFLTHACALAREHGFTISNIDCTLICEFPKIGPHTAAMKAAMAQIMDLSLDRVSVKATTSEKLGFTGRGEGIASIATAALVKT